MRVRVAVLTSALALTLAACGDRPAPDTDAATSPSATPAAPPVVQIPADRPADPPAGPTTPLPAGEQGGTDDWRKVVSPTDASNLARLDQAWRMARIDAEQRGSAAQVEALGPLVDPNAGRAGRLQPPPGAYRCRAHKLGSNGDFGSGYLVYPWFACTVELTPGGDLILTKTTGSQRTRGLLYPDTDRRLVFVGAQAWGLDEQGYPAYGQQSVRDQVGVLERIGSDRWRLVIPWPRVDSKLEILELVRR